MHREDLAFSSSLLAAEFGYCDVCAKAYNIHLPHPCPFALHVPQLQRSGETRRAFQFVGLLVLLAVSTSAIATTAFVSRNSLAGLIGSDIAASFAWVFCPCLPLLWTQPSLVLCRTWIFILLVYPCFAAALYLWNWPGMNVMFASWIVFIAVATRWKLPTTDNDTRFGLESTVAIAALLLLSKLLARATGLKFFSWGILISIPIVTCTILFDIKYHPQQQNSYAYALMFGMGLCSIPLLFTQILQSNFNDIVSFAAMVFLGTFLNWGLRTIVHWAGDNKSSVILMFPVYLAEDLFQTMLFADTGSLYSYRFWALLCAQESFNLLKHLGTLHIIRYYIERMWRPSLLHPYHRPGWVVRLQILAIQDSASACVSVLVAMTAALVDTAVRNRNEQGTLVFSRQTRLDVLAGLYGIVLGVRIIVSFLEHVVARRMLSSLRTFNFRSKISEILNHRPHSSACCLALSCFILVDSIKWRSYHLSGWPSLNGFVTNI